jgi:NAD-dependent deacetylase
MPEVLQRIREGLEVPDCPDCHGILKPDAVFFGEALPQETLQEAIRRSRNCDFFVVIGSTLVIYPAAYIPTYAVEAGAKLAIINLTETPFDHYATVIIREKAGDIMAKAVERIGFP